MSSLAGIGAVALLAGCGQAPDAGDGGGDDGEAIDFLPCIVSDSGGFDDRSFNQSSFEGLVKAADDLGIDEKHVESQTDADYSGNISSLVDQGCDLIVSVGFKIVDATKEAAKNNPDIDFVMLDDNSIEMDNVKSVVYDTAPAAFLAGYAAADTTESGVVGTFGGMKLPTVTIFMDGFVDGVEYYNEQKDDDVKAVGWDTDDQDGLFTGGFEANDKAKQTAVTVLNQDADIILPVGGPIFLSAIQAIDDTGDDNIGMIGVDADLYKTADSGNDLFLTSIMKQMKSGVNDIVTDAAKGDFTNEPYIGTLENEGVGIAPFHSWEDKVSDSLQDELDDIKKGIIDGSIEVESPSSPEK